jgi:hypothetical protein
VALIATMFHVRAGITTAWHPMSRLGYTAQMPIHPTIKRDEPVIAPRRRYQWPAVKELPHTQAAWICFADECGQTLKAHKASWAH